MGCVEERGLQQVADNGGGEAAGHRPLLAFEEWVSFGRRGVAPKFWYDMML